MVNYNKVYWVFEIPSVDQNITDQREYLTWLMNIADRRVVSGNLDSLVISCYQITRPPCCSV